MPSMDMSTGKWAADPASINAEIRRLRQDLVHARQQIAQNNERVDTRNEHAKAAWFEALCQACAARGFKGSVDRPFHGPFQMLEAYDQMSAPVPSYESAGADIDTTPIPSYRR